jgi:hypothetical protein
MKPKKHLFDKPENVSLIIRWLMALCAILFALDFILQRQYSHAWESLPGFYALFGFIGCVLLVIIAKWLRTLLMRPTNYYQRNKPKPSNVVTAKQKKQQGSNNVAP